jgi:hypothetical protein
LSLNGLLPQGARYRDSVMPVLDKVDIPNLDQGHRRQRLAPLLRGGNAQPAFLGAIVERAKVGVEIGAAAVTAADVA